MMISGVFWRNKNITFQTENSGQYQLKQQNT